MPYYRKKPVVVEAKQWDGSEQGALEIIRWLADTKTPAYTGEDGYSLHIRTLSGPVQVQPNDYVIRGVAYEAYPCDPDIFMRTYEDA